MNYIKSLEKEVQRQKDDALLARRGLYDLLDYMKSPKFRCGDTFDGYINIDDVRRYLEPVLEIL